MHRKRAMGAAAWLLLVASPQAGRAGTVYSLRDLGGLGGSATATAINGSRQMAGVHHAFELTPDFSGTAATPIPEPLSTLGVGLALVLGGVLYRRRRRP
jgi:hypothetical protein